MRILLDTHAFLWWANEPGQLSERVLNLCVSESTDLLLSTASLWEIQIKAQIGKLELHQPLQRIVQSQQSGNGLQLLAISPVHVFELDSLPMRHKDPFDRIIIAQAKVENLSIVSKDALFKDYPVNILW